MCIQPNLATMQRHYPPKHLFSHCRQIYCHSQDDDERLSEKQIDIISSSLDEITETVASLVVSIKIYPVVLNHGIAHDYGEQQKKQCHYKVTEPILNMVFRYWSKYADNSSLGMESVRERVSMFTVQSSQSL